MIKKIVESKIAKIITVVFVVCKILFQTEVEIATRFSDVNGMTKAGLRLTVGKIVHQTAGGHFSSQIPGIRFVVQIK